MLMVFRPPLGIGLALVLCLASPRIGLAQAAGPTGGNIAGSTAAATDEESPLLNEPKTPQELLEAVILFVDLARPKLASRYLEKLMKENLDDATLLQMRDKHGPAVFLKLSRVPELRPLSVDLMNKIDAAIRKRVADPAHIDQLVTQLGASDAEREIAILELKSGGVAAVPRLISHLTDPKMHNLHGEIVYALGRIGEAAVGPLLAALEAPDAGLREDVLAALGLTRLPDVAIHLWYPAYGPDQPPAIQTSARDALARLFRTAPERVDSLKPFSISEVLRNEALRYFRGSATWKVDDEGRVSYWTWDASAKTVVMEKITPDAASLHWGMRFAREALSLSPENQDIQALFLALALTTAAEQAGWGRPLPTGPETAHDLALAAGETAVTRVLSLALENGRPICAVAALGVLSQIGSRQQLNGSRVQDSPVLAALNYPDRRVQFAAATMVLELNPTKPFRSSTRVVAILQRALNDEGIPAAVVVDANSRRASVIAQLVNHLGYRSEVASTGRDGFRIAAERMDVELILLNDNTIRWGLSQTLANLRADARTASIPVAVYGDQVRDASIQRMVSRDPLLVSVAAAETADGLNARLGPFLKRLKAPPFSPFEREQQRATAAAWLAHLADVQRDKVFDIRPTEQSVFEAISDADLAGDLLFTLGTIPTVSAQKRLMEIAVSPGREIAIREKAARQLAFHVQSHGLLLSREAVAELRAEWQRATEPGLKTALASVIGSLEPSPSHVGERLRSFSEPAHP